MEPQHWKNSIENNYCKKPHCFHYIEVGYENTSSCFTTSRTKNLYWLPQSQHPTLFSMANISTTLQGHLCLAGIITPRGPGEWVAKLCMHAGIEYEKKFLISVLLRSSYKSHQITSGFLTHLWSCQRTFDAFSDFPSHLIMMVTYNDQECFIPFCSSSFKLFLWYSVFHYFFPFLSITSTV